MCACKRVVIQRLVGNQFILQPVERSHCGMKCHSAMEQSIRKTATETHGMLVQVYEREAVSRKCVYECIKRFREGKETTDAIGRQNPRNDRETATNAGTRSATDLCAEKLGISKDTMHTTVRDDLRKRKLCFRFMPYNLTEEQKAKRIKASGGFISMCDQDPFLLKTIVTGDETLCYRWCSPRPQTSRRQKSKVKTLLIAFFDNNGIVHRSNQ
ncbi:hypothetical protein QE152_g9342 [Popillia japonica]|uniref:Mos1 transposase HTH domain-containing protein n=1 Tax=Popillia japonica TaxID=7064 RepID=A0AAW1LZW8_POPJA